MDLVESKINVSARHPWELTRSKVILDLLTKKVIPNFTKGLTVFDIGCGDIFLADFLSKNIKDSQFLSIDHEFNDELIQKLIALYPNEKLSLYKTIEEASAKNITNTIDLILLLDVIEHIPDDISFLKNLCLNPQITRDTYFLITVPAFQSLFCSHDVYLKHYRRYSNKSLKSNLETAGLEVIEAGYFFSSLLLPRSLKVLQEKISKPESFNEKGVGEWKSGKIKDGIFESGLLFDYKITQTLKSIGLNIPGLSNYAICRKRA